MNRFLTYSLSVGAALGVTVAATTRTASAGQSGALVRLQATTPGSPQTGHINVSGAVRAGGFAGNGTLLTALNWNNLINVPAGFADNVDDDTQYVAGAGLSLVGNSFSIASGGVATGMLANLAVTDAKIAGVSYAKVTGVPAFLTSVATAPRLSGNGTAGSPLDIASMGATIGKILRFNGTSWAPDSFLLDLPYVGTTGTSADTVFKIYSTLPFGAQTAIYGKTNSAQGVGVKGESVWGLYGLTVDGRGVVGEATGTGTNYGGYFTSAGALGNAIFARATGGADAATIFADGVGANAIDARSLATTGTAVAISATNQSPEGKGIQGSVSGGGTGTGVGVSGISSATDGFGISGGASGIRGTAVYGSTYAENGTAIKAFAGHQTGANYGAYIQNDSTSGTTLFSASNGPSGTTSNAVFNTLSANGVGVYSRIANFGAGSGIAVSAKVDGAGMTAFKAHLAQQSGAQTGLHVYNSNQNGTGIKVEDISGGLSAFTGIDVSMTSTGSAILASAFGPDAYALRAEHGGVSGTSIFSIAPSRALQAEATDVIDPNQYTIKAIARSREGTAVYGLATASISNNYITRGVFGEATGIGGRGVTGTASANSGPTYGGRFTAQSDSGVGLYGGVARNTGFTYGVMGEVDSKDGVGVRAISNSTNLNSTAMGLYASDPNFSGSSYGIFAGGVVGASIKAWVIDHPLDPANMTLRHFCAEGPDALNIYKGAVKTDAKGYATVTLPDYYEAINRDGTVQLTVIDDGDSDEFVQAKVVGGGIRGNGFRIRTSSGGVTVHWRVEGIRNDPYVQKHPPIVEVPKIGQQKGKYWNPEVYNLPESEAIRPTRSRLKDK